MTSKLTRERLEKIKSWRETYGAGSNVMLPAEEAEELACLALAAMDSEPVSQKEPISFDEWSRKCALQVTLCHSDFREKAQYIWDSARETMHVEPGPLYRHAQPGLVIPDEMTSEQAHAIGYYYGDPVDVFARGANWMRQYIIDSTLAASTREVK